MGQDPEGSWSLPESLMQVALHQGTQCRQESSGLTLTTGTRELLGGPGCISRAHGCVWLEADMLGRAERACLGDHLVYSLQ